MSDSMNTQQPTQADAFHAHLDDCKRCRENPFDLCPMGGLLLTLAASLKKPDLSSRSHAYTAPAEEKPT